jgi:signal transduction histidine kinase
VAPVAAQQDLATRCLLAVTQLTTGLTESADMTSAGPGILRALGENLGWQLGVISVADRYTGAVLSRSVWHQPQLPIDLSEWETPRTETLDLSQVEIARRRGLELAASVPLVALGVSGLIEFFAWRAEALAREMVDTLGTAGALVGQFIGRLRADEEMLKAHHEVELRVVHRTAELVKTHHDLQRALEERSKMEQRLLLSDRLAAIGTLAAGVAHEINNPLAYVVSNLTFITTEVNALLGQLPPERSQDLTNALREASHGADRVRQIVADLRLFSQQEGPKNEKIDLQKVLDSALNVAGRAIRDRARLVTYFEPTPIVEGSASRLGQVFLNLLINAAQAIPEGQKDANVIHVTARTDAAGHAIIEITDSGSGIAPEIRKKIFDPFFTTKSVGVGTGLGLSIVHGIVSAMRGEISVESDLGKGTMFRVTLPGGGQTSIQ